MTSGGRGRWIAAGLGLAAIVVVSLVLGRSGHSDPLTGSLVWMVCAPPSIAATFAAAVWNALRGVRRLAAWQLACAFAVAGYWLGGALTGTLAAVGAGGTLGYTLIAAVPGAGWTVVLALLQATAVIAGQTAGYLPRRRWPQALLLGGAVPGVVLSTLSSPAPGAVPLLPAPIAGSDAFAMVTGTVYLAWIVSLVVAPVWLFVLALRESGTRRRGLARIAVGSMVPALVVLLCGLLAALVAEALGWTGAEAIWLAVGFLLAVPATSIWLSATVKEATDPAGGSVTSISMALRLALWSLYVLGVVQFVGPLASVLGGGAAAGAIAMALALAATFWPWRLLVAWCVRKSDPRTLVASRAMDAASHGSGSAAVTAQRVLREALGDQGVRVLIDRGGRWVDADGAPAPDPEHDPVSDTAPTAVLTVVDAAGTRLGVALHGRRFVDLRPLASAVAPLFERAAWEADLREQAARTAAERARADAAAAQARRTIERDLHDGVQGRLVSLGLGLRLARDDAPDALVRDAFDHAVAELQGAVAELRELASGSLSARLDGRGLAAAVGELAARAPVPVSVDIPRLTLPPEVESTAYFVIAEAVTNAVKHASAERIAIRVVGGAALSVEVSDDGTGGAHMRGGTGLRGLQERVHAIGGRFVVGDRQPCGTIIEAVLPCGS